MDKLHNIKDYYDKYFNYNPETGLLTWKHRPKGHANAVVGNEVGGLRKDGYREFQVAGIKYRVHRVIWYCENGEIPDQIDHINGIRDDNRMCNLRNVTEQENHKNLRRPNTNTSGFTGLGRVHNKWRAYIQVSGNFKHLGLFETIEEAIEARRKAEIDYGFHCNHGR